MKSIILVGVVVVAAICLADAVPVEPVAIVRSVNVPKPEGGYDFDFESSDGILRTEQAELKEGVDEENKPHKYLVVRGSWTYVDPEGKTHTLNYLADENGFQPVGEDIPQLPVSRR